MKKDLPSNDCEKVKEKMTRELTKLHEKKLETDLVNGRTKTYIADRIYKFRKDWWSKWFEMLNSEDASQNKTALIEYNKLQQRVLPTQLEGSGGSTVQVNILNGIGVEDAKEDEPMEVEVIK